MPTYKLTYFNARARAELCRLVFHAAGQDFEDVRMTREDFPAIKPTTPFGQVPMLEIDGKPLAQGNAIARFLAREFGLAGKNSWEQALADQYIELTMDMFKEFVKVRFEQDETKKEELKKDLIDNAIPKYFGLFEKALEGNGCTFLVGSSLTVADLAVFNLVDILMSNNSITLDKYPKIAALKSAVEGHTKLGKYLKERPTTPL